MEWFSSYFMHQILVLKVSKPNLNMWLSEYEYLIEAFFGAVSLFTLLVVILLNYRSNKMAELSIRETRLTRELEMRPYVYFNILLDHGGGVINFSLYNRGKGIAKNIRLHFDQPIIIDKDKNRSAKDLQICQPISFLAPQRDFNEFVGITHLFFKENEEVKELTGRIEYQDATGKTYTSPLHINIKALSKRITLRHPTFHNLVDEIERMEQDIRMGRYFKK